MAVRPARPADQRREHVHVVRSRGPGRRIQKGQLGPDQAGALGPSGQAGAELGGRRGVHEHPHAAPVGRHGGQGAVADLSRARARAILPRPHRRAPHVAADGSRITVPSSPSTTIWRAVGDLEQLRARKHGHRNPERARHDRRVRGHSASGKGDSGEPLAVLGHVRGPKIVRHEDERRAVRPGVSRVRRRRCARHAARASERRRPARRAAGRAGTRSAAACSSVASISAAAARETALDDGLGDR